MPASPSDARNKWRKRKRDPHVSRRQKHEEDEEDDDDVDDELDGEADDDNEQQPQQGPLSGAVPDHAPLMREVLSDGAVRISEFPSVVKHTVNRPHSSVLAIVAMERTIQFGDTGNQQSPLFLENISHGQLQALSAVPADSPSLATSDQERSDGGSYVVAPPQIMEGRGVIKRFWNGRVHAVPMHSDWFSPNTVHRLERQVVPHFFSGKSPEHTPELYMECRNFIVAKYMECPERRLLVSDCKGLVAGIQEEDLTRIVRFLDHWGIINYCAAAPPNCEPWSSTSYLREDSIGEVHVPSAALKSIDSLIKFDKPKCRLKAAELYSSLSCNGDEDSDLDCKIRERLSDNRCNYCSRPLPTVYYQSQKEVDVLLCTDCFYEGRFVTGHSSIDFMRVDSTKDYGDVDSESWSDQETLLLLEALESYNENWNDIAEHVGTKSKAQCILHFIRMPMEDGLLENIEVPSIPALSNSLNKVDQERLHTNSNGNLTGSCLSDLDSDSRLPFANSGNPVMSMVAFLATAVGPRVAAACAHASLIALSEENALAAASGFIIPPEGSGHGNRMKEGGPPGDLTNSSQHKDGNIGKGSWGQNDAEVASLHVEKVRAAAKAGLAAAAMKAKLFADHEEREIQRLSANIINHQLKRLELKLKQFAEVETLLMKECEQVERARQRFVAERARIISTRFGPSGVTGVTSPVNLPGVAPALVNNNTGNNNRQQIMSAPPSQPSISGYGSNNQQMHPHMSSSFMPRQPMFSFGPRLPLAAIQPSSSSPLPNAMFNNSGNSQPTLNHPMMRPVSGTSSGLG